MYFKIEYYNLVRNNVKAFGIQALFRIVESIYSKILLIHKVKVKQDLGWKLKENMNK